MRAIRASGPSPWLALALALPIVARAAWGAVPASVAASPHPEGAMPVEIERITGRIVVARCPVGSNVTAIRTDRGLVIVDTHLSPASMRAIREKIEEATGERRVRYVINTHGHWDHCSGNQVFPESTVIGHATMPAFLRYNSANPLGTMWAEEAALAEDRELLAATRDPERAAGLRARISVREQVLASLESEYVPTPPGETFEDRRDLDLGDVTVRLRRCGPAHTVTDIFVYVPGERVLVTGDVFCSPTSFCFRVCPLADLPTLLAAMDDVLERGVDVVIPGHGRSWRGSDLRALRDRLAGEFAARAGARSAALTVQRVIAESGVAGARRRFLGHAPDSGSIGYLSEEEFHILGNRFVHTADLEASTFVFELARDYFPKSSLIQGGLGRVRLLRGDTLQAISAYERAYELAPHNRQAEAMLRVLGRR